MYKFGRAGLISIAYSSILIISLELLFLILVPRIYTVVNTLPLLFLSQILRIELFLFTLIISFVFFLFLFISNFYNEVISLKLVLNFLLYNSLNLPNLHLSYPHFPMPYLSLLCQITHCS